MPSIQDPADPRLTEKELNEVFTPTAEEFDLASSNIVQKPRQKGPRPVPDHPWCKFSLARGGSRDSHQGIVQKADCPPPG